MSNSTNTRKNNRANGNTLPQSTISGTPLSKFKGNSRKELLNYIVELENKFSIRNYHESSFHKEA